MINETFLKMQKFAKDNSVPIINSETARLLSVLVKLKRPEKILEIGTAIGYSSAVMMESLGGDCEIVTVERDFDMVNRAREFLKETGYFEKIKIIGGEATEVLPNLQSEYDFIFLDAAKGQYIEFLPQIIRLLKKGGVLVSDNVLYKGMITKRGIAKKKHITIIRNLRDYLSQISDGEVFETTILSIGDGVSISYKLI